MAREFGCVRCCVAVEIPLLKFLNAASRRFSIKGSIKDLP